MYEKIHFQWLKILPSQLALRTALLQWTTAANSLAIRTLKFSTYLRVRTYVRTYVHFAASISLSISAPDGHLFLFLSRIQAKSDDRQTDRQTAKRRRRSVIDLLVQLLLLLPGEKVSLLSRVRNIYYCCYLIAKRAHFVCTLGERERSLDFFVDRWLCA